jgi:hypothetical protein
MTLVVHRTVKCSIISRAPELLTVYYFAFFHTFPSPVLRRERNLRPPRAGPAVLSKAARPRQAEFDSEEDQGSATA